MRQINFEFASDGATTYRLSLEYDEGVEAEQAIKEMQGYVISFFATLKALNEAMKNPSSSDIDDLITRIFKPDS